jgi:hypothetical protein
MDLKTVVAALNNTERCQVASYVDGNYRVSKPVAVPGWFRGKPTTWTAWVIPTSWHGGVSAFIILAKPGRGRGGSVTARTCTRTIAANYANADGLIALGEAYEQAKKSGDPLRII